LSEKANFAQACIAAGIIFIGPGPKTLADMGDKAKAKSIALNAGVSISPGSEGVITLSEEAVEIADSIGYPVMIKASAGGGGRGMKVFYNSEDIKNDFDKLAEEALRTFAKSDLYIEKYFENIRHIEVQVICDGNEVYVLGARDCTIQRKNQKLIEESPATLIDKDVLNEIYESSRKICISSNYLNIGTIEYIYDLNTAKFYFLEMNTRIQVEHPVTEMCFNIDLVEVQIKIANKEILCLDQSSLASHGHAIECRINAENPDKKFMPSPGVISKLVWPNFDGVRVDSHIFEGYSIPIYYDSLIAKIICHSKTRETTIELMKLALSQLQIEGIKTTIKFHISLMNNNLFKSNLHNTQFISLL
jgi:acetyl-CoA carboxylase biotin carboxylase subunit